MEQFKNGTARALTAAGLLLALAFAAAQHFSPAARLVRDGRDVRVAVLGDRAAALLVYHSSSGKVSAFQFQNLRRKKGASPAERAAELASLAVGADSAFHISVSTSPELEILWRALDGWRASPAAALRYGAWLRGVAAAGATDLSAFGLFTLLSEFSSLGASDFVLAEAAVKQAPEPEAEPAAAPAAAQEAWRVEVFNASGRKDLAARAAKRLRALGFDVITASSYSRNEKHTRILGFSKDTAAALRLRSALGLEELEIRVRPSQKSVAGAAVILGADFDEKVLGK